MNNPRNKFVWTIVWTVVIAFAIGVLTVPIDGSPQLRINDELFASTRVIYWIMTVVIMAFMFGHRVDLVYLLVPTIPAPVLISGWPMILLVPLMLGYLVAIIYWVLSERDKPPE